jgi:hypothetical protein
MNHRLINPAAALMISDNYTRLAYTRSLRAAQISLTGQSPLSENKFDGTKRPMVVRHSPNHYRWYKSLFSFNQPIADQLTNRC